MRDLLVIGAGGLGRETAEAVRAANNVEPTWNLLGLLDDAGALHGTSLSGIPVLGPIGAIDDFPGAQVVVCTGSARQRFSRKRLVQHLALPPERYASVVHPASVLAPGPPLGPGTVVLASVVTTTAVEIGAHVTVMPAVVLTHDDVVGDFATFGAGVRLAGRVRVGEGAYLGAGSLVREDTSIGPWALVGMGATVLSDVPAAEVWVGAPARFLRRVEVPSEIAGT